MTIITKITHIFSDIRSKIKPQHIEFSDSQYLTRKQSFSGFDEFNPTKMDSDDDIVDIGVELIENREESDNETKLNHHKTTTQKVLNFLA